MSEPTGFLLVENFEETAGGANDGYDAGEWTETIGTNGIVDQDDTTATILRGTQQLKVYAGDSGQYSNTLSPSFTASDEVWFHCLFRHGSSIAAATVYFINLTNAGAPIVQVGVTATTGTIVIKCGTPTATTTNAISADTDYHIWVHYKKGTGSNAEYSVEVTAASAKAPTGSGDFYAAGTDGTRTQQIDGVRIGVGVAGSQGRTRTAYFDQVYVDDSAIGDLSSYDVSAITLTMSSGIQSNVGGTFTTPLQTSLDTANGIQQNVAGAPNVSVQITLDMSGGAQQNVADSVSLAAQIALSMATGINQNVSGTFELPAEFILAASDAIQKNAADVITLVIEGSGTEYTLTMYDGHQVQVGDAISLNIEGMLNVAGGLQQPVSSDPELSGEFTSEAIGSVQVNAGDAIGDLPVQISLAISEGAQSNVADVITMPVEFNLAIFEGKQVNVADVASLIMQGVLSILDGIQVNTAGTITLSVSVAGDVLARLLRIVTNTPARSIKSNTPQLIVTNKTANKSIELIGG